MECLLGHTYILEEFAVTFTQQHFIILVNFLVLLEEFAVTFTQQHFIILVNFLVLLSIQKQRKS